MPISRIRPTRTTLTRHIAATSVLVAAAAAVVLVPSVANASVNACTSMSGTTSNLAVSAPAGVHPTGGTIFTKQPPGCLDLNLTKVSATDHYEGWLQSNTTGKWSACSAGFLAAPPVPKVLCTSVATGTHMAIVQQSTTRRTITAQF